MDRKNHESVLGVLRKNYWKVHSRYQFEKRKITELVDNLSQARRSTGAGVSRQLAEIILLRLGKGKLDTTEYYDYRLYDSEQFRWAKKTRFFGKRMENRLGRLVGSARYGLLAHDKVLFYLFMERLGFAIPRLYGIAENERVFPNLPSLNDEGQLAKFLREEIKYPFVAKPIWGIYSRDVYLVQDIDDHKKVLLCANGERLDLDRFCSKAVGESSRRYFLKGGGFLFQEVISPHPQIMEKCGHTLSCIRFVVFLDRGVPKIIHALWKIPSERNMADNYWRPGNALGLIDMESGRVERVVQGRGFSFRSIQTHSDTGRTLVGFTLPLWAETIDVCKQAALTIPGLPMQAWDIALTRDGQILLEVNVVGGLDLPQLATQQGFYDEEAQKFLKQYGF